MAFLLQLTGGTALQYALDTFFDTLHGGAVGLREVTKSAFSQARKKLKASAFVSLNRFWTEQWHETLDFQRWCGLRVVGRCQDSCRKKFEAQAVFWGEWFCLSGVSGLRWTLLICDQSRVVPDQRLGLVARAAR